MEYKVLPGTGLQVSRLCLGTMTFGDQADFEESEKILHACLDAGVNFIDTADIYCKGESEKILGKLLPGHREELVIATKVGGPSGVGKNGSGLSRKHIIASVENSLKRMNTDYTDILYCHFPDRKTPYQEIIATMNQLIREGKIRYYGLSNFSAWQCCQIIMLAREMNMEPPIVGEMVYNLLTRGIEDEFLPFSRAFDFGIAVYNPLAGGLLTGKHLPDKAAAGSRFDREEGYRRRYWNDSNFRAMESLTRVAEETGISLLELSFRWLLNHPEVTSVISGASKAEQIRQNLGFFDGKELPAKAFADCDEAWKQIRGEYFSYHR
ncbi:MAG: aldo/keto reductase [Eubacteriales bacterium]|nr:aldo/keto reductase [Eubacteriales bacterium]